MMHNQPQTVKDVLIAARELISTPDKWTKGSLARNAKNQGCWPGSPDAVCFCILGALERISFKSCCSFAISYYKNIQAKNLLRKTLFPERPEYVSLRVFNDAPERTHQEVLALFDRAIASCPQ